MTTLTTPRPKTSKGPAPGPRWPFEMLELQLRGCDHTLRQLSGNWDYEGVMPSAVAHVIGVHVGVVHRWKKEGLTSWAADKAAIAIGLHPIDIWDDWYKGEGVPKCA